MARLRWGVLGTSNFARNKMIPALQQSAHAEVCAIASRSLPRAEAFAAQFGIARAYGTYRELLSAKDIDVIYNPLPNHLHVPWSIRALEAGKHVLCEKPIALSAAEAQHLAEAAERHRRLKVMEAFMYRMHPQWERAKQIVGDGGIGELRTIHSFFSYFNRDARNIRNQKASGGGGLLDIGCYCIQASRYAFAQEPTRVVGLVEHDPAMTIDRLTSAILDFPGGQAIFTCSTQLIPYQRVQFLGTKGRIEIEIPFNAPKDRPTRLFIDSTGDLSGSGITTEEFPIADQYTMQGDAFSKAVLDGTEVPVPLEDAIANMAVIEAVFRSGETGRWESPVS